MNIQGFASTAVFAEDIRDEQQGTISLIGVMPDNIELDANDAPGTTTHLSKLVVYIRTIIPITDDGLSDIAINFCAPSGQVIASTTISPDFIQEQIAASKLSKSPHTTIISQFRMTPFPILEKGLFTVTTRHNGNEYISGFVNFFTPAIE